MAFGEGRPMYCLISARSTNARSIAPVIFEVVKIMTLGYLKNKMILQYNRNYKERDLKGLNVKNNKWW